MWILISWLLRKPADLDLHCLLNGYISGFIQFFFFLYKKLTYGINTVSDKQIHLHYLFFGTINYFFGLAHYDHYIIFTCPCARIKFCYFHIPAAFSVV